MKLIIEKMLPREAVDGWGALFLLCAPPCSVLQRVVVRLGFNLYSD